MKKGGQVVKCVAIALLLSACHPQPVGPDPTATAPSRLTSPTPSPSTESSAAEVKVRGIDGADMRFVPAGEFLMGSDSPYYVDEGPQQKVYVDAFWIDRIEVTNERYNMCADAGDCLPSGCADDDRSNDPRQPVVCVSWHDAAQYARWVGGRLPTEAEWEKAARGTDGREYPWGNQFEASRVNTSEGGVLKTTPAGQYSPDGDSPYGAADMAGNVWEWTNTLYKGYPYHPRDGREDPEASGPRVMRGGSYLLNYRAAYCAARRPAGPSGRSTSVGFRVAMSHAPSE